MMLGFAEHMADTSDAHLLLAGPKSPASPTIPRHEMCSTAAGPCGRACPLAFVLAFIWRASP